MEKKYKQYGMVLVYLIMLLGGAFLLIPSMFADIMEIGMGDLLNLNLVVGIVIVLFSLSALILGRWKQV